MHWCFLLTLERLLVPETYLRFSTKSIMQEVFKIKSYQAQKKNRCKILHKHYSCWLLKNMFFGGCDKNEVFKDSKKLSRNIDKKLNVKDKDMCYFYRERERERERE